MQLLFFSVAPGLMHPVQLHRGGRSESDSNSKSQSTSSSSSSFSSSSSSSSSSESNSSPKSESSSAEIIEGTRGIIKGFGYTSTDLSAPAIVLKFMHQEVISQLECRSLLGSRGSILTDSHFCAIDRLEAASACVLDNGNGFVVVEDDVKYVIGILSIITNMCRPQFPAMYTRVNEYTGWIDDWLELWSGGQQ